MCQVCTIVFLHLSLINSHVCLAYRSVEVYSLIIGRLSPVGNLTVTPVNSTTLLISWSPPFTLEGVPILGYNVTITNVTSVTVNNTWLYYPYHEPTVIVTVVARNKAGGGHPATISKLIYPSPSGKSNNYIELLLSECTCT